MSTQDCKSPDSSPSEGKQDATRQDPNPSDIDNDGEDLNEVDDTTSISPCSTPPGLNDALGLDELAIRHKPTQSATPVADINSQLTTTQVFVPSFYPPPMAQSRYREELRQRIGSKPPPDDQLTRILQVARWNVDIAVSIFHLWHHLGPPPKNNPNGAQSNRPQQSRPTSFTEPDIDKIEAADIEVILIKSAAEAAAANSEMRASDESSSPAETDKEESGEAGEERKAPSHDEQGHNLDEPGEAAEGGEHPLRDDGQRLGSDINAASGELSREEIAERRRGALLPTQLQTPIQPPPPTRPPPMKKLPEPWKEGTRTPGGIRAGKVKQCHPLTTAPQDDRPQPTASEPSTESSQPESMQLVSSRDEQHTPSTETPTLILRVQTQASSPTALPSTEPPTLTLRGRTQEMTPTAQKDEDQDRSILDSNNNRPNEPESMQYVNVFPPHGYLLNPAPPSASPRKPRPRHTMAEALEHVKAKELAREAAEAAAVAESSGSQTEQAISNHEQSAPGPDDRTSHQRESASSVDQISDEVQNLMENIDGHDVGVSEDAGRQPMEDGRLADTLSKEDTRKDG